MEEKILEFDVKHDGAIYYCRGYDNLQELLNTLLKYCRGCFDCEIKCNEAEDIEFE